MARAARIEPAYLSQMLKGSKTLRPVHALAIASYLGFSALETDYLIELARLETASTEALKKYSRTRLVEIRRSANQVVDHPHQSQRELTEEELAMFLSSWHYDAVRLASSVPQLKSIDAIAERLNLSKNVVGQVFEFLLQTGFCISDSEGFQIGRRHFQIAGDSPLIDRYLLNWRVAANERISKSNPMDLYHSIPTALTSELAAEIRKLLKDLLADVSRRGEHSKSEKLMCLNLDWFEI